MIVILKVKKRKKKKKEKKVKHLFGKSCMFLYNNINSFRRLEDLWIVDMDRPRLYRLRWDGSVTESKERRK